jgi:hypothetical protein
MVQQIVILKKKKRRSPFETKNFCKRCGRYYLVYTSTNTAYYSYYLSVLASPPLSIPDNSEVAPSDDNSDDE